MSSIEPIEGSLLSLEGIDDSLVDHDVAALENVQITSTPCKSAAPQPAADHSRPIKPFTTCSQVGCQYKSRTPSNVTRHHAAKHDGLKYECETCRKTFVWKQSLATHNNTEHAGPQIF